MSDAVAADDIAGRRDFWTTYQPGFRVSTEEPGSPAFYEEVERRRYELEPAIPELARFGDWADRDVLECGCGIATDGMQFVRAGARYTGVDFSPTALALAGERASREPLGANASFVRSSIAALPFPDESFDLAYSMGVIHHAPETRRIAEEMHRVLRPGGEALVMVYHRSSLNYYFTIMLLRRALAATLLLPGMDRAVAAVTGERPEVLAGHKALLREHGVGYLTDHRMFLSHNTDGPGNPLSKVYTRRTGAALFDSFEHVDTEVRFLNLRAFPAGERLNATAAAERLGRRWGWHLWIRARKAA